MKPMGEATPEVVERVAALLDGTAGVPHYARCGCLEKRFVKQLEV